MSDNSQVAVKGKREANREQVRERLLDAAEELFAVHGYAGTGVREITQLAGMRLASINDHVGGKEELFREVIRRRAGVINADREQLLSRLSVKGPAAPRVRALVEAFAMPMLTRAAEGGAWLHYLRLVAQISTARMKVLLLITDQFNPIAERFVDRLRDIFPDAADRHLYNAYQFMLANCMVVFSDNHRINSMTNNRLRSRDFHLHYEDVIEFVTAGILALGQKK